MLEKSMDDTILAIETFFDFLLKFHSIENTYSYHTYDDATDEEKLIMKDDLKLKLHNFFIEYIDWLVEEYGEAKHRICLIIAFKLIYEKQYHSYIRNIFSAEGAFMLWEDFEKIYREKMKN